MFTCAQKVILSIRDTYDIRCFTKWTIMLLDEEPYYSRKWTCADFDLIDILMVQLFVQIFCVCKSLHYEPWLLPPKQISPRDWPIKRYFRTWEHEAEMETWMEPRWVASDNGQKNKWSPGSCSSLLNDLQMKALARQITRALFEHAVKVAQIHRTQISAEVLIRYNPVHVKKDWIFKRKN